MAAPGIRRRTTSPPLTVYGRPWCALSQMARRYLERNGIPYDYVDLDSNPDAERQISWLTGGRVRSPTISLGGQLLVQPSTQQLARELARNGIR